jgi:hypothetical protein
MTLLYPIVQTTFSLPNLVMLLNKSTFVVHNFCPQTLYWLLFGTSLTLLDNEKLIFRGAHEPYARL